MPRSLLVLACAAACLAVAAPAYASGPAGSLTQPAGAAGCVTQDGTSNGVAGQCADGRGLTRAEAVAVSPDGMFVYSYSVGTGAIAILSRDPVTGVLSQADAPSACVGPTDLGGDCTDGPFPGSGADSSHAIAISSDGAFLFAAGHGVGSFRRDVATGALTAIGCVSADGKDADGASTCTAFPGLGDPLALAVSPDGRFVYTGGLGPRGIAILSVSGTGVLGTLPAPDGCFTNVADVECTTARYADQVFDITLSLDGHSLYAVNIDVPAGAVVGFARDAGTGKLTQIAGTGGCVDRTGAGSQPCTLGHGMVDASTVTVSPDGTLLTIGTQPLPNGGDTLTLAGVDGPAHGTVSFSGLTATYTPATGFSGDDSFRLKGNDGANDSAPATVTVHVGAAVAPPAGKRTPLKLSLSAKPRRDRRLPYKFRFSGKLTPAAGAACSGKVVLTVKHGNKKVARKSVRLSSSCKWKAVAKFKNRKKLGKKSSGKLKAKARFGGGADRQVLEDREDPLRLRLRSAQVAPWREPRCGCWSWSWWAAVGGVPSRRSPRGCSRPSTVSGRRRRSPAP